MPTPTPRLSDIVDQSTSRRAFLTRASVLVASLPMAEAAVTGCTNPTPVARAPGGPQDQTATATTPSENPDSRLDSSLKSGQPSASSATPGAVNAPPTVPFHWYDPALPPLTSERTKQIHMTVREVPIRVTADTIVAGWTFDGSIPGPILHVRRGDTVEFTLTNQGSIPHSMDFHASQLDPKTAFQSAPPGHSVSYTFRPRYAGVFLYHCGTAPVLMHIGSGMFGAMVVDPPTPLPPAREFVLVQNEYYLAAAANGVSQFDYIKMLATVPDYVAFNGGPSQYQSKPLRVRRGERVRFYVVAAGPNHPCSFHIVGKQFDTVYLGAPPGNSIQGVQTFSVAAGGGMIFEFIADIPGEFPFVNHAFGHGQKGAIGILVVE
jgi:nitrite reductase (NO-forming)